MTDVIGMRYKTDKYRIWANDWLAELAVLVTRQKELIKQSIGALDS